MVEKEDIKSFMVFILLCISIVFSLFLIKLTIDSGNTLFLTIVLVIFVLGEIILFIVISKSKTPLDFIIPGIFAFILALIFLTSVNIAAILSSFILWTIIGVTAFVSLYTFKAVFPSEAKKYYFNVQTGEYISSDKYNNLGEAEKRTYNPNYINSEFPVLFFKILRTIALAVLLITSLWVLISSPFSFFGGSLYGGFMQVIITLPLILLLSSFWTSGNNVSIILIIAGCFAAYMLSFMFPTLFANLWIVSSTSSASAGASTISSFNAISPLSYYKSTYIVKTGQTEKRIGPTYELVTDEVVSTSFDVQGRLCDESILVASVTFQNKAKYELSDLSVQLLALRNPYCFGSDSEECNICNVIFTQSGLSTYTEAINNLPKGVPKTVNVPFTTRLAADVMEQVCKIRSNILIHYHTTSVFPLSFIDYDAYLISPKNIGNPISTSSFGKVLLSMDVGQQPVVVNNDTKDSDTALLKLAWTQKGDGLVNSPKIVLYLPRDFGECQLFSTNSSSYTSSLGTTYYGLYGYNTDKTKLSDNRDFSCSNYASMVETTPSLTVEDYCSSIFAENIESTLNSNETAESLLYYTPEYEPSFEGMPSFNDACTDLASRGYSVCVAINDVKQNDVLHCPLSLKGVDVSKIDLSTYLIRADALYNFNAITEEQFVVSNCNAI